MHLFCQVQGSGVVHGVQGCLGLCRQLLVALLKDLGLDLLNEFRLQARRLCQLQSLLQPPLGPSFQGLIQQPLPPLGLPFLLLPTDSLRLSFQHGGTLRRPGGKVLPEGGGHVGMGGQGKDIFDSSAVSEIPGPLQGLQQGVHTAEHAVHPLLEIGFVPPGPADRRFLQELTVGRDRLAISLIGQKPVGYGLLLIQTLHLPIREVARRDQGQKKQDRYYTQDRSFHSKLIVQDPL